MTAPSAGSGAPTRRSGPPLVFALLAIAGLLAGLAMIATSILGGGTAAPTPAAIRDPGPAAASTAAAVVRAVEGAGLRIAESARAYRPPESTALRGAPRRVLQVGLAQDEERGFVIVYEFGTVERAQAAADEYAAYLGSGVGRVQFPIDTRFTLRRLDTTLVFFEWSPENAPDPQTPRIEQALATIGDAVPIPA